MIDLEYPHIFTPLKLRNGKVLRNRITTAPSNHGHITDSMHQLNLEGVLYYGGKAKGGAAQVSLGEALLDHGNSSAHNTHIDLTSENCLPSLHRLTGYVHMFGSLASIELNHNGQFALPEYCGGAQPMAASEIWMPNGNHVRMMNEEDMMRVADSYVNAARMAARGGFDTVLLHYGHGWLMGGFLSPIVNKRQDEYGGSVENRCRFPLYVLKRLREEVPEILVELRISGSECTPGGVEIEECTQMCEIFAPYVDMMHISCGTRMDAKSRPIMHPSHFLAPGHNAPLSARVKQVVKNIPVGVVGGITDPMTAERILAEGSADYVCCARAFIADPNWVEKAKEGKTDEIRPCVKCLRCLDIAAGRVNTSKSVLQDFVHASRLNSCTVNPVYGRQVVIGTFTAPARKKKVVIVGGGPGGMQAAVTAASRGHEVTLFEASDRLGGQLAYADFVWFKQDMMRFREYLVRETEKCGAEIRINTRVTPKEVEALSPDAVIVAIGADEKLPEVPVEDKGILFGVQESFCDPVRLGDTVAIVGGGMVGCELALHLADKGKKAVVIQRGEFLAKDGYFSERTHTISYMDDNEKITYMTGTACIEVKKDGVIAEGPDGRCFIPADSVVFAAGMKSRSGEADRFYGCAPEVRIIGDCAQAGLLYNAIKEGFDAGFTL